MHLFVTQNIELQVGGAETVQRGSWTSAKFEKLGYVKFQDNKSEHARELKSIYVDTNGWFLRLVLGENYPNQEQNPCNQVGIVSVTLLGYYLPSEADPDIPVKLVSKRSDSASRSRRSSSAKRKSSATSKSSKSSRDTDTPVLRLPSGDGDRSYAEEMRQIVKTIEKKKKTAVQDENFGYAKKAKYAKHRLEKAIDDLDGLEQSKREAIEDEDFDRAQELKEEMKALRASVYSDIKLQQLLNDDEISVLGGASATERPPTTVDYKGERTTGLITESRNRFQEREDTVIPAVRRKSDGNIGLDERPPKTAYSTVDDPLDEAELLAQLHPSDRRYASSAINVFGFQIVKNAYSKNWEQRRDGLLAIKQKLNSDADKGDATNWLQAAQPIIEKGLRDKVFAVYSTALDVLNFVVLSYIPKHKLQKSMGSSMANRTASILVSRTGDTINDKRFPSSTFDAVTNIVKKADQPVSKAYVNKFIKPFEAAGSIRVDQGQAEIVYRIVTGVGAPNREFGLDEKNVCEFAVSCLMHTDVEVRNTGKKLIIYMYKKGDKGVVRSHLPPYSSNVVHKNPLFRTLYDELDKIDGSGLNDSQRRSSSSTRNTASRQSRRNEVELLRAENRQMRNTLSRSASEMTMSVAASGARNRRGSVSERPRSAKPSEQRSRRGSISERPRSAKPSEQNKRRNSMTDELDRMCMFCGQVSDKFTPEGLDKHYLRFCVMLKKCDQCNEMVEIAKLKHHYLEECRISNEFKQCPRCKEPILNKDYANHVKNKRCLIGKPEKIAGRCVLCHEDVYPNTDDGWRKHLTDQCRGNKRQSTSTRPVSRYTADNQIVIFRG
uniref:UVR domain-containing protein n=1 Tax=Plectus sambesii TaxID=2011161 RepID=A0A914XAP4_9BILA